MLFLLDRYWFKKGQLFYILNEQKFKTLKLI